MENKITDILLRLGVPPHLKGFNYIKDALLMLLDEPDLLRNVTKGLYVKLAQKNNDKSSRVERALRHAICKTFNENTNNTDKTVFIKEVFGNTVSYKPCNAEFLSAVFNYLKKSNARMPKTNNNEINIYAIQALLDFLKNDVLSIINRLSTTLTGGQV